MGKNTYYSKCYDNSEYSSGDFKYAQIDLPPGEVGRIFKARAVLAAETAEHPDLELQSLKISSTAAFGDLDIDVAEELDDMLEDDFLPENPGWAKAFNQGSTEGNRILLSEYGVEWQGYCKYTHMLVYTEVGWGFFESFVLKRGLIDVTITSDVRAIATGIVRKRDVSGLVILADALDEAGNPAWIGTRLRELMKDFGSDEHRAELAYKVIDGLWLKRIAGPQPKPKKVPRGKGKKKKA